jgi:hypothetical protein
VTRREGIGGFYSEPSPEGNDFLLDGGGVEVIHEVPSRACERRNA